MRRSTEELLGELLPGAEHELARPVALPHRLHAARELAHAELRTAAAVEQELPVESVEAAGTGRLARIGPADGAVVAVRAELDGLPVSERTGVPFAAGGGVMHACGHDVHMAALVALAHAAHRLGEGLPAALLAVFQPGEEAYPSGAEQLAAGELAAIRPPAIVAGRAPPELPWGTVPPEPGRVNRSGDNFEITVEGAPPHGAYPHRGPDPILAIAQI